jgi:hypothetical protein
MQLISLSRPLWILAVENLYVERYNLRAEQLPNALGNIKLRKVLIEPSQSLLREHTHSLVCA